MTTRDILMNMARQAVKQQSLEKEAVVPPMPAGGAPMDPAMAGGAPPMDPAMMGGAPPMDPAMMGGAPPGGAPPMDPAMAGMMGAAGMAPPVDPATAAGGQAGAPPAGQKMKPEQYMQMLDYRLYNLQQQLTLILNAMDLKVPPDILVTPPGATVAPQPESAVQGGEGDPTTMGAGAQGEDASAIKPIEPMAPAFGAEKAGGHLGTPIKRNPEPPPVRKTAAEGSRPNLTQPQATPSHVAAVASLLRSRAQHG